MVSKFDQPPEKQEIYQQFTKLQSPLSFKIKSSLNDILENMKTYIKLIFLLTIPLSLVSCAQPISVSQSIKETKDYKNTFQQLNTLDKIDRKVELFEKLFNDLKLITTSKKIIPYLDWLKKRTFENNKTFRYSTLYSLYLAKINKKDYSKAMMLAAKLRLKIDFSRCKNQNNSLKKYIEWQKIEKIILKDYKKKNNGLELAILLENRHKNRPGDPWLCSSIDWVKAMKQYDKLEKKEINNSNYIGKSIAIKPTQEILLKPTFVSNQTWLKNRKNILEQFKKKYQ